MTGNCPQRHDTHPPTLISINWPRLSQWQWSSTEQIGFQPFLRPLQRVCGTWAEQIALKEPWGLCKLRNNAIPPLNTISVYFQACILISDHNTGQGSLKTSISFPCSRAWTTEKYPSQYHVTQTSSCPLKGHSSELASSLNITLYNIL